MRDILFRCGWGEPVPKIWNVGVSRSCSARERTSCSARERTSWGAAAAGAVVAVALVVPVVNGGTAGATGVRGALAPAAERQQQPARSRSALDPALETKLADKMSRSTSGRYAVVVDIAGVGRVASIHPARALRPASTQKLFTALPLLLSRPDDALVTDVALSARPHNGVVDGNVVVHASADPSLARHDLNRLARLVREAGVRKVTGQLRLDIGNLPLNTRQDGWKWDFVPNDIGPLSPFPVNRDAYRRTAAYLSNPTAGNLQVFRNRLEAHGVHVKGSNAIVRETTARYVVASHHSRALRDLIKHTLRWSDNFYAESLLAVAGGRRSVEQVTTDAGVTDTSIATDGSGLSYDDRQTARGEVTLLNYANAGPAADSLLAALPVGCKSGTLEDRFCHTDGKGTVFAKTGTLSHTKALSGFTTDALGRWVTFSIICGRVRNLTKAMNATDRAVLVLRHYSG